MATIERVWHTWRGSDEVLARAFRAACEAVEVAAPTAPVCTIEVRLRGHKGDPGDIEVFGSPDQFRTGVTPEALRRFEEIRADVVTQGVEASLALAWVDPPWTPSRSGHVTLTVTGEDEAAVERASLTIASAVSRAADRRSHGVVRFLLEQVVAVVTFVVGLIATIYLTGVDAVGIVAGEAGWRDYVGFFAVLLPIALVSLFVQGWLYPSLEVSREGKSTISKARSLFWSLVVGLVGTALAKLIFG